MMFDVSQPDNIQLVGQFSPGGAAEDVILDGNVAYVAFFDRGVYAIDIKDPGYPKKLAHINTPGNARGLVRHGDYLYIADWLSGIQIYNVAQPSQPHFVGSYDTVGAAWGLAIKFPYAYVMDWWGGFTVLDISSPPKPRLAGQYQQRDRVYAIRARENIAYVASGTGGLQIYDIKNPLNPTWMTGVDLVNAAIDVATLRNRAYVATTNNRIVVIDISDSFSAHIIEEIKSRYAITSLQAQGGWLNVNQSTHGTTLYRIDGKYANKPRKKRHYKQAIHSTLVDNGNLLLTAQADYTMSLYNSSDKKPLRQIDLPGEILRSYQNMMISYSRETGISIIDRNGDIISNLLTNMKIIDLQAQASTLYLVDDTQHLVTVDISQPDKLRLNSNYPLLSKVNSISLGTDALYFSGQPSIVALKLLPEIEWQKLNDQQYQLTSSPDLPVGSYNLNINNSQHNNALTVDIMKFSRPRFTMEEFKKALTKFKQEQ